MSPLKKKAKAKPITLQVTEKDGEVKKVGRYYPEDNTFKATRIRSEHFMRKYNSWGLDAKVVDYLISKGAYVIIKDKESKWEFKSEAGNFKLYGTLEEHKKHRPQYFLPLEHWEIIRANNKSFVVKCEETSCRHNFGKNCLRGVIEINKDSQCSNYVDRN